MEDPLQGVLGEGIDMADAIARIERRIAEGAKKAARKPRRAAGGAA
jgi:hypothetical protein